LENGFRKIGIKGDTGSSSEIGNKGGSAPKSNKKEIEFGKTAGDIGPKGDIYSSLAFSWEIQNEVHAGAIFWLIVSFIFILVFLNGYLC
jgi:hypothetical protein